jgi:capsular exopolysaccharide synthesis family protein
MMSDAVVQIILVTAALATIAIGAMFTYGIPRVFLLAQVFYWTLSYVARSTVLLWVQPEPRFGDSVADLRLYTIGYDRGIAMVLPPVAFGLWVYAALVVAFAIWARRRRVVLSPPRTDPDFIPALWTVYVIGLLGRLASYLTGTVSEAGEIHAPSPLLQFVTLMAVMGSLGLIIFIRPASGKMTVAIITVLTAGEFVWTVVSQSKTPILGAALAIAIRFALTGWTPAKIAGTAAIAVVGVGGFGFLQSFKESDTAKVQQQILDASYPHAVQPFLSILRRFDLLSAATDSYYMAGRRWLTPMEVVQNALKNLVPGQLLGSEKLQSGTAWASEVRGASVDMTHVSVSLAEGNINEGFVFGGYAGVVVSVVFTFVLLLAAVRALHGTNMIVLVSIGLALTELPALFERGILGTMEVLGKTIQVAILVWLIYLVVSEYRKRRRGQFISDITRGLEVEPVGAVKAKGYEMKLIDYVHIARRRWLIIVGTTVLGAALAAAYVSTIPTTYEASSRVYVTMATGTSVQDSYLGNMAAQQRVTSYADLATSSTVAQRVIDDLGLSMSAEELQGKIKATFPPATSLVDISVTDGNAARAQLLTDKVVAQFRKLVDELETTVTDAAPAARVTVVDFAKVPTTPVGPNAKRTVGLGLLMGLVIGGLAALLRDRFDGTLRTSNDLAKVSPVATLAIIDVGEPGAEGETRRLRARLIQAHADARTLMITSLSTKSEPEVAVSLSRTFADTGRRVVLIDADTSGEGSSKLLGVTAKRGLGELLHSTSSPFDALVTSAEDAYSVLPIGAVDADTSDLLDSERFAEILSSLRAAFDYVIVGTAPVTSSADPLVVSARCDGSVAVVELGATAARQVRGALATFEQGGSDLLGVVAISRRHGKAIKSQFLRRQHEHDLVPQDEWHVNENLLQSVGTRTNGSGGRGSAVTDSGTSTG